MAPNATPPDTTGVNTHHGHWPQRQARPGKSSARVFTVTDETLRLRSGLITFTHMKTLLPSLSAILLLAATVTFTGCSTVNLDDSGDTQAVYQFGGFEMLLNSTAPIAFNAAQKALKELDLYQTKGELFTFEAQLAARSRDDKKVYITITEINSKQTLLKIRWGTAGSKANSRALYDAIEKNMH